MTYDCNSDKSKSTSKTYSFEELLDKQGYLVYTSVGISMLPLIRQCRDLVEIRPKDPDKRCKRYDVVLFKSGDKYILHRVLKVRDKDYVICGDHNIWCEKGITDQQILGVMTRLKRDERQITPDNSFYKFYVHLWCDFYPVRAAILYCMMVVRVARYRLRKLFAAPSAQS